MVFLWFSYGYPRVNVYSSMWKTNGFPCGKRSKHCDGRCCQTSSLKKDGISSKIRALMGFNTMWGPQEFAKLVNITPISMVDGTYNYSIHGVYKPTYNWGASHCRIQSDFISSNKAVEELYSLTVRWFSQLSRLWTSHWSAIFAMFQRPEIGFLVIKPTHNWRLLGELRPANIRIWPTNWPWGFFSIIRTSWFKKTCGVQPTKTGSWTKNSNNQPNNTGFWGGVYVSASKILKNSFEARHGGWNSRNWYWKSNKTGWIPSHSPRGSVHPMDWFSRKSPMIFMGKSMGFPI